MPHKHWDVPRFSHLFCRVIALTRLLNCLPVLESPRPQITVYNAYVSVCTMWLCVWLCVYGGVCTFSYCTQMCPPKILHDWVRYCWSPDNGSRLSQTPLSAPSIFFCIHKCNNYQSDARSQLSICALFYVSQLKTTSCKKIVGESGRSDHKTDDNLLPEIRSHRFSGVEAHLSTSHK